MRAVVTGANRGLGAEVARQLRARGDEVVGTSRSGEPRLDLDDLGDVRRFAGGVEDLDVLVNNAGVSLDGFDAEIVRDTLTTNLVGPVTLTEALLPKLRAGGRVVMVSSGMGERAGLSGAALRALTGPDLDGDGIIALGRRFAARVADGTFVAEGWPASAYAASKALLNAYAEALAARLAGDPRQIRVVAVCPGWVRTRMGGPSAPRPVERGAEGIVWAATADDVPASGFFRDERPIAW